MHVKCCRAETVVPRYGIKSPMIFESTHPFKIPAYWDDFETDLLE